MGRDPKEKRKPLLADRFLALRRPPQHKYLHHRAVDQITRGIRNARKFVFDEEAAEKLAHIVMAIPDLIVREHEFARTPYDITWIEFPSWKYWVTLKEERPDLYASEDEFHQLDTADFQVGYLIDHYRVNTICGGTVSDPTQAAWISPLQYRLHTEWPIEDQIEFCSLGKVSRFELAACMWGSSFDQIPKEKRRLLRDNNIIELTPRNPEHHTYESRHNDIRLCLKGAIGDIRTLIAMLLMLNRPSITRYVQTLPNSRGWVKNKPSAFMSHTVVQINMDAARSMKLIGTPSDDPNKRKRHEVRGHYCHDRTAREYMRIAGCLHEWIRCDEEWTTLKDAPASLDIRHWLCSVCGGKRWRRDTHERGTAEKGFVQHDGYEVSP